MKSWKITEVAGIGIYVHWSFLILPLLIASSAISNGAGIGAAIQGVLFVLAIFGCVVLHELGQRATSATIWGSARSITLLPIGGVAALEQMPRKPLQELAIAVAGPAVNVVIAGILLVVLAGMGMVNTAFNANALNGVFLVQLLWANIGLVLFNLLPAFPMDGGRVLRSTLAAFIPHAKATQIAATVGQIMAGLFILFGIWSQQWMLIFVAVFIYFAGRSEALMAQAQSAIEGWRVADAMRRQFHMVPADITLEQAAQAVLMQPQEDFPVVDGSRLVGMLGKRQALTLLAQGRGYLRAREAMRANVPALDQSLPLDESITQMQSGNYSSMPVTNGGRLVGILSATSLQSILSGWTMRPVVIDP